MYEKVPLEDDFIFEEEEEEETNDEQIHLESNDESETDEEIDLQSDNELEIPSFDHVEVGPRLPPVGEIAQTHNPKYLIGK